MQMCTFRPSKNKTFNTQEMDNLGSHSHKNHVWKLKAHKLLSHNRFSIQCEILSCMKSFKLCPFYGITCNMHLQNPTKATIYVSIQNNNHQYPRAIIKTVDSTIIAIHFSFTFQLNLNYIWYLSVLN